MLDAEEYGDAGSNTLRACYNSCDLQVPNLARFGLFNIESIDCGTPIAAPEGAFVRLVEKSKGKDTTIGHWKNAGVVSPKPLPTYPNGFPQELLDEFCRRVGRGALCNKPYSGTQVLEDYGKQHMETQFLNCVPLNLEFFNFTEIKSMQSKLAFLKVDCVICPLLYLILKNFA